MFGTLLAEPLSEKPSGLFVGEVSAMYEREGKISNFAQAVSYAITTHISLSQTSALLIC